MPEIQASDVAHAHALYVGAALAESQSDFDQAREMLETCLTLRRGLGNPVDIAATLSTLSPARLQAGDAAGAEEGEQEALRIFRELGDRVGEAIGLLHLGQIGLYLEDDAQANAHLEQCLAIAREIKHQEVEGECELVLGETALEFGDRERACLRFKRSLTVCRDAGDKRGEANALWWLGKVDLRIGDTASAKVRLADALNAFRASEMWEELLGNLEDHAALALLDGRAEIAVGLAATTSLSRDRLRLARSPRSERHWHGQLEAMRQAMSIADFDSAWSEGRDWQIDQAIRAALTMQQERIAA